jgi:tRNA(Ile)-lysidine synthase
MPRTGLPRPPAVARVLHKLTATARTHEMFDLAGRVVVAVSGGPDSLCLLHSLVRLQRLLRIRVTTFHFDHHLREDSWRDARYVAGQSRRLGVPIVVREARTKPRRGESVEAWARTVRYGALTAVLEELGGGVAAVAHTADDQAETVLLALLRGGGLDALSGMSPVSRPIVRPLLEVSREETVAFCRSLRLRPREDPMNRDPAYLRVGVRRNVIPLLEERLGRGVRQTLARTAALLAEDAELLDAMAKEAAAGVVEPTDDGRLLRVAPLRGLPRPLAARVVRRELLAFGLLPESAAIDAVLDLVAGRPGRRADLPEGLSARREREYVRLSRPSLGSRA